MSSTQMILNNQEVTVSTWRLLLKSIHIDVKTKNVSWLSELNKSSKTPVWRVWEIQHTDVQALVIYILTFAIHKYLKTCLKVNTRWCVKQQRGVTLGTQQIYTTSLAVEEKKILSHTLTCMSKQGYAVQTYLLV